MSDNFARRMVAPLAQVADLRGRTRRASFWPYMLLLFLIYVVASVAAAAGWSITRVSPVAIMLAVTFLLALLAAAAVVRRLHDVGWSGWWFGAFLLALAIFVGAFFLIRYRATAGDEDIMFRIFPGLMAISAVYWCLGLLILVVCLLEGTRGPNRFGEDPNEVRHGARNRSA